MRSQNNCNICVESNFCGARSLPSSLLLCTVDSNISDFDHSLPLESRRDHSGWDSTLAYRDRTSTTDIMYSHAFSRIGSIKIVCVLHLSSVYYEIRQAHLSVFKRLPYSRPWLHWSLRSKCLELLAPREVNLVRALQITMYVM